MKIIQIIILSILIVAIFDTIIFTIYKNYKEIKSIKSKRDVVEEIANFLREELAVKNIINVEDYANLMTKFCEKFLYNK